MRIEDSDRSYHHQAADAPARPITRFADQMNDGGCQNLDADSIQASEPLDQDQMADKLEARFGNLGQDRIGSSRIGYGRNPHREMSHQLGKTC